MRLWDVSGALYYRYQMDARGENPFTVTVWKLIIRVSDQLAAGEIKLIETTPEESEAAKARIDEVLKKLQPYK
ncbi:hypothetical protein ACFL2S_15675 [Thermodesulfobacteriota bacterium]